LLKVNEIRITPNLELLNLEPVNAYYKICFKNSLALSLLGLLKNSS